MVSLADPDLVSMGILNRTRSQHSTKNRASYMARVAAAESEGAVDLLVGRWGAATTVESVMVTSDAGATRVSGEGLR